MKLGNHHRRGVARKVIRELEHGAMPALRRAIRVTHAEPHGELLRMHLHQELAALDDIRIKLKREQQAVEGGQAR